MSDEIPVSVRRFSRSKREEQDDESIMPTPPPSPQPRDDHDEIPIVDDGEHDDFLADLKNGAIPQDFQPPPPIQPPKLKRQANKKVAFVEESFDMPQPGGDLFAEFGVQPKSSNTRRKREDSSFTQEFGDIFSQDKATPILGKSRRELLTRLSQYKTLFPDDLKNFRVKTKATDEELQAALDECDTIVSCSSVNGLINEAFFSTVSVVEGVSSRYEKMDISGTAAILRHNPEVAKLLKLISIKYNVFSQAPPETQLLLITISTAMVARTTNQRKKQLGSILNTPL